MTFFQFLWTKYWNFTTILLVPRDSGNFRLNTEICTYASEAWGSYLSNIDTVISVAYGTLEEQLSNHFDKIFNPFLSAFRKGFSCQSILLAITEEWRRPLDWNEYVAAILMDLSKAFDCLPSNLIKDKLIAYVYRCSRFDKWLFFQSKTMC